MTPKRHNWFVYMHTPNHKDMKHGLRTLQKMQTQLHDNVGVVVLHFGPTVRSDATLTYTTRQTQVHLLTLPNSKGIDSVIPNIKQAVKTTKALKIPVTALCFWCHGSAVALSPWKKWKEPFLHITDVVQYLIKPLNTQLVCFDACFQGSMSSLYEMSDITEVVVASPAFHPYTSILTTSTFGNLNQLSDPFKYAHALTCNWNDLTKAPYKCLLVFDMVYIRKIAVFIKYHFDELKFTRATQIDKEDANLHDIYHASLYTASSNMEYLQSLITKSIHATCSKCRTACTKKVKGPSMEAHLPRKWISDYQRTRWYREIVQQRRGFRT